MELTRFRADALGLTDSAIFQGSATVYRRVAQVDGPLVWLDGGAALLAIPRVQLPKVAAGQWLRFSRTTRSVLIEVDAQKSRVAENRLSGLFARLSA